MSKKNDKLTQKQERFCNEYIIDFNATKAYTRAGYSATGKGIEVNACKLLKETKIANRVSELKKEAASKVDITKERVLKEIAKIAFMDETLFYDESGEPLYLDEIPEDIRSGLANYGIKTRKIGDDVIHTPVFKTHDKIKALDMLGKYTGLYEVDNEQKQQTVQVNYYAPKKPPNLSKPSEPHLSILPR